MKITLDTNCLIDLDEKRVGYENVQTTLESCLRKNIEVAVLGISASEKRTDVSRSKTFSDFKNRLASLELGHITILKPFGIWGLTYWDNCLWAIEEMSSLHETLMDVLFVNSPYRFNNPEGDAKFRSERMNRICDAQAMWAHIWNKRDIFVTSDSNFHTPTKKQKLLELGAGKIVRPIELTTESLDLVLSEQKT